MKRVVVRTASKRNLQKQSRKQLLSRIGHLSGQKSILKRRLKTANKAEWNSLVRRITKIEREIKKTNEVLRTKK